MKTISIAKVLDAAGGALALYDMLAKAGQPVPLNSNAISVWHHRGRLPSKWAGAVLYALYTEANVDPIDLLDDVEMTAAELAEELGL